MPRTTPYSNGKFWINGKWKKPEYLAAFLYVYFENIIGMIVENQADCFDFFSRLLGLDVDAGEHLEYIQDFSLDEEAPAQNFPSLTVYGAYRVDPDPKKQDRVDIVDITLVLELQIEDTELKKQLATVYLAALHSILDTCPTEEFTFGWPPPPYEKFKWLKPRKIIREVRVGIPSTEEMRSQVGLRQVLEITLTIDQPRFDNF